MSELEIGSQIEYERNGKVHKGTIYAIKKIDNESGTPEVVGYLVDTGNDTRVDEHVTERRGEEIMRRVKKEIKSGSSVAAARAKVLKQDDLPKQELVTKYTRQPEQVEIKPEEII